MMERSTEPNGKRPNIAESQKQRVLQEEKRMQEFPVENAGKDFLATILAEKPEQGVEGEAVKECVRCGRGAYLSVAEDGPLWFVRRLITEFVREPRKNLCHNCLSGLYEQLGLCVQANWEKIVKSTSL